MKTTIELPDALFLRAKTVARLRGSTLKRLVIEGLETVTAPKSDKASGSITAEEAEFMELDPHGVPVLRRRRGRKRRLTNQKLDAMREELGV